MIEIFTFAFNAHPQIPPFADALTFLDVRLAKEVVPVRHRNFDDAGDSALGLCVLIACES